MGHTYTSCLYHCVFSTKGRRNIISDDLRERLWAYIGELARENGMKALCVGGTENHVHVLLSIPPAIAVSKAMQLIKGNSSKWISETFASHRDFTWQQGYGAFSLSISGVEETRAYIRNQREHHRSLTFEEEFVRFLRRHEIEYDERYVWG